jgi:hypothetical protein
VIIAAGQKLIAREFRKAAHEFRVLGDEAVELWGELDQQGRELQSCPSLSLLVGKTQELWSYASHYGSSDTWLAGDAGDRFYFKKSLREFVKLKRHRRARMTELRKLIARAQREVRTEAFY